VLLARSDRIHAPADFAGLRVRTQPAPLLTAFYEALGAQPTWMTATAARTAAASGELDAEDGSAAALAAARLDALGFKYLTIWGATGELALFAVNGGVWSGMTEAQRAAVQDTANEAAAAVATLARQEEDRALDTLRQRGVTITRLLAPSQAAFAEAAKAMTQRWTEAIGPELVQEARAAAGAAAP
jgi:TRAP-type C4-dicarboxylate transport system substrate-binding protein